MTRRKRTPGGVQQSVASPADSSDHPKPVSPKLPKGGVNRINIGQSFAEYDPALDDISTYVLTPAYSSIDQPNFGKYFFVGRRGAGKTALRRYSEKVSEHSTVIVPEIFSPSSSIVDVDLFANSNKRPFRSLVSAFKRTLLDELLISWMRVHPNYVGLSPVLIQELESFGDLDFDSRAIQFISRISRTLIGDDEDAWLRENKMAKLIADELKVLGSGSGSGYYSLLVDSIDDFWDGSEQALAYLTAFMHACLEVSSQIPWARALMFLRENIFERVRARDSESSRIETTVVGLDWTQEQLLEMVERRLNRPFNTKFALGGPTWNAFFEDGQAAQREVLEYCQYRPRDVLIYVNYAVEYAQSRQHERIMIEDVQGARRRFSDNRFKDLGDEYAENYPQIAVVLSRFYGLGRTFTYGGIEDLLRMILEDSQVKRDCASWIYEHSSVENFVRLLYSVGFVGFYNPKHGSQFRALGPQDTSPPSLSYSTEIVVHRTYWAALDLQDILVRELPSGSNFGKIGIVTDLPGGHDHDSYISELDNVTNDLRTLPKGAPGARGFEDLVGKILKLCFFRSLQNIEPRVRDVDGNVIRDWVAANRAPDGFWEMVRTRYQATNVIWECKNYETLWADDFHQVSYYIGEAIGKFTVIAFRGDSLNPNYYQHIRRISNSSGGFVLPLTERDLLTFLRQARSGKIKEDHIHDRYDAIVRKIS